MWFDGGRWRCVSPPSQDVSRAGLFTPLQRRWHFIFTLHYTTHTHAHTHTHVAFDWSFFSDGEKIQNVVPSILFCIHAFFLSQHDARTTADAHGRVWEFDVPPTRRAQEPTTLHLRPRLPLTVSSVYLLPKTKHGAHDKILCKNTHCASAESLFLSRYHLISFSFC